MRLKIAIPTFNRAGPLAATLNALVPQLTPDCRLVVFDNCSPVPARVAVDAAARSNAGANVTVVRHPTNLGGLANLMRCFEAADPSDEWLWVLGDDDLVRPDAVARIAAVTAAHPDAVFVNFATAAWCDRPATFVSRGVEELVRRMEEFHNTLFISSGVYRAAAFRDHLSVGYHFGYSLAPQFAMLLSALGSDGEVCWSKEQIVDWEAPAVRGWSFVTLALGLPALLDLPIPPACRQMLGQKMWKGLPAFDFFLEEVRGQAISREAFLQARYVYGRLQRGMFEYDRRLSVRARARAWRLWFALPFSIATPTLRLVRYGQRKMAGLRALGRRRFLAVPG
jgi:glycosyltransferase involved in cell wall biosynthesis